MARLSFRCDEELVRLVDEARGDVARERWLRRAIERALTDPSPQQRSEWTARSGGAYDSHPEVVAAHRSSTQAKTGVGPRPKGGKS